MESVYTIFVLGFLVVALGINVLARLDEQAMRISTALKSLGRIERNQTTMSATIADLDAALAQEDATLGTLASTVTANDAQITALLAKIAAGQQVDVTAELTKIQTQTAAVAAAVNAVVASDARTS